MTSAQQADDGTGGGRRWRSVLFSPATRADRAGHLAAAAADVTVVDLEDAVAASEKVAGRDGAQVLAATLAERAPHLDVYLRVNPVGGPWFEGDLADGLAPTMAGVVVPKVGHPDDVAVIDDVLAGHPGLRAICGIETAAGVHRVDEILAGGTFAAAYFGAEDYVADLGGTRTPGNLEVLFARSKVALAARMAGIPAVDQVFVAFRDAAGFLDDAGQARAMGYAGKLCIHPGQVPLAHEVFSPSAAEIDHATRLLAAFAAAGGDGGGVAVFEGQMVDAPMVRRARRILATAPGH